MTEYYNSIISKTKIFPKTILEIGSRDGEDAESLRKLFHVIEENVWVVEPNPIQYDYIKHKFPKINTIPYAIFNKEEEHEFYQVFGEINNVGTSSLINREDGWYNSKSHIIKVKTITGKTLLKIINSEIDICKIDVEGLTYEVLESFDEDLHKIKSFHLESEHKEIWKNQKLYPEIKSFMVDKGYSEIYFNFCANDIIQSDSIWVKNDYLKSSL